LMHNLMTKICGIDRRILRDFSKGVDIVNFNDHIIQIGNTNTVLYNPVYIIKLQDFDRKVIVDWSHLRSKADDIVLRKDYKREASVFELDFSNTKYVYSSFKSNDGTVTFPTPIIYMTLYATKFLDHVVMTKKLSYPEWTGKDVRPPHLKKPIEMVSDNSIVQQEPVLNPEFIKEQDNRVSSLIYAPEACKARGWEEGEAQRHDPEACRARGWEEGEAQRHDLDNYANSIATSPTTTTTTTSESAPVETIRAPTLFTGTPSIKLITTESTMFRSHNAPKDPRLVKKQIPTKTVDVMDVQQSIDETPQPIVVETPQPVVVEHPQPIVVETQQLPVVEETQQLPVVEETQQLPVVEETQQLPVVEHPRLPVVEHPQLPVVVETPLPIVPETVYSTYDIADVDVFKTVVDLALFNVDVFMNTTLPNVSNDSLDQTLLIFTNSLRKNVTVDTLKLIMQWINVNCFVFVGKVSHFKPDLSLVLYKSIGIVYRNWYWMCRKPADVKLPICVALAYYPEKFSHDFERMMKTMLLFDPKLSLLPDNNTRELVKMLGWPLAEPLERVDMCTLYCYM
jgi:hypothetical protein